MFIVISVGDGVCVRLFSREQLAKYLKERAPDQADFVTEDFIKEEGDTAYWGGKLLIIKGSVVVPQPKTVVTEFDLG